MITGKNAGLIITFTFVSYQEIANPNGIVSEVTTVILKTSAITISTIAGAYFGGKLGLKTFTSEPKENIHLIRKKRNFESLYLSSLCLPFINKIVRTATGSILGGLSACTLATYAMLKV